MDACDSTGRTPLCAASKNGHDQVAEMLLDAGACVNARDEDGSTALHVVASTAHVHMVHLLASHGAALRAVNANKQTPLEIALRCVLVANVCMHVYVFG
jgi:ankyrin repeat protein